MELQLKYKKEQIQKFGDAGVSEVASANSTTQCSHHTSSDDSASSDFFEITKDG